MFRRVYVIGAVALSLVLVACHMGGGSSSSPTGIIQLSPYGTAAAPVDESITQVFTLTASENFYTGNFTAQTIVGKCWVVQPPISSSGTWAVAPAGPSCVGGSKGDTEQIQVKDSAGNTAVTYIHSV